MQINEQVLDELVSGTLTPERYRSVLQALESHPSQWRDCALAFLQEQAFAVELRELTRNDIDWGQSPKATEVPDAPSVKTLGALAASPSSLTTSPRSAGPFGTVQWVALAALLLVSFSCGWYGAGVRDRAGVGPASVDATPLAASNENRSQLANADVLTSQPPRRDQLPWLNQDAVQLVSERIMPLDLQVPPELLELERRGQIRVETFDAMMPISFDNGTSALVPVQQFRVVPVVHSF